MKKIILLMVLIFSMASCYAIPTKGILNIDFSRTKKALVGETYNAILTLVPLDKDELDGMLLENQDFLNSFYITKIFEIKESENNHDAVVVKLNIILKKSLKKKSVELWKMGAKEIPVSYQLPEVTNTKLLIKDFLVVETRLAESFWSNWWMILTIFLLIFIGTVLLIYFKKKKINKKIKNIDFVKEMNTCKSSKDFEWIYRNRDALKKSLEDKSEALEAFVSLLSTISSLQYKPDWGNMNLSVLIDKKNKIVELYKNGI